MMTGTSKALSAEIPFIPRERKQTTIAMPPSESHGAAAGYSASSPASIAADGIKQAAAHKAKTAGAPLPNSTFTVPRYPPCFFPAARKNADIAKKAADEQTTANANDWPGKNRTSSAPETNPAPITVPTMSKVSFTNFILVLYAFARQNMPFFAQNR